MLTTNKNQPIQIEYTCLIWKEDNLFIAYAIPLDLMSCGENPTQAKIALEEAVNLFLSSSIERDTLTEILEETGYKYQNGKMML
jgi:hypothetical protein